MKVVLTAVGGFVLLAGAALLVLRGCDPPTDAFTKSLIRGDWEETLALIEKGAKPVNVYDTALMLRYGQYEAIENLAKAGVLDVNERVEDGDTALHFAMDSGINHEGIEILLELGADPTLPNGVSQYPLHRAVAAGLWADNEAEKERIRETVRLLLEHGADPNRVSQGSPPLTTAIASDDPDLVDLLIRYGAKYGGEALIYGSPYISAADSPEMVEKLLALGHDLESCDNPTQTSALQDLIRSWRPRMVREFLRRGANPLHTDIEGKSVLDYADRIRFHEEEKKEIKGILSEAMDQARAEGRKDNLECGDPSQYTEEQYQAYWDRYIRPVTP